MKALLLLINYRHNWRDSKMLSTKIQAGAILLKFFLVLFIDHRIHPRVVDTVYAPRKSHTLQRAWEEGEIGSLPFPENVLMKRNLLSGREDKGFCQLRNVCR